MTDSPGDTSTSLRSVDPVGLAPWQTVSVVLAVAVDLGYLLSRADATPVWRVAVAGTDVLLIAIATVLGFAAVRTRRRLRRYVVEAARVPPVRAPSRRALRWVIALAIVTSAIVVRDPGSPLLGDRMDFAVAATADAATGSEESLKILQTRGERSLWLGRDDVTLPEDVFTLGITVIVPSGCYRSVVQGVSRDSTLLTIAAGRTREGGDCVQATISYRYVIGLDPSDVAGVTEVRLVIDRETVARAAMT